MSRVKRGRKETWASRAALGLAILALRAKKENQVTLDHLALSLGTLMARWWSRSLAPQGHQGKMEPLAGMASLEILARTANPVKWGPRVSLECQGSRV